MQGAVCISGFGEGDVLAGAIASVAPLGWRLVYGDGAYELAVEPGAPWKSDEPALRWMLGPDAAIVLAPPLGPWSSEAVKRTAIADFAQVVDGPGWSLWLDCDERVELPSGADNALEWLDENIADNFGYARVSISTDGGPHGADWKPRMLRLVDGIRFEPPMDFDVWLSDWRVVSAADGGASAGAPGVDVPTSILRIRHDRHLKSIEAQARAAAYARRRKDAYPAVCV